MTKEGLEYDHLKERLKTFIGETVIVYTTSGGITGAGFTGVLILVNECFIRLLFQSKRVLIDIPINRIASFTHDNV